MKKDKIICFDIETTGLNPFKDEILQLSIVNGNGNVLFNEFIKPENHTDWAEAAEINGITPEMVADKQPISHWMSTLQAIFDNADLIVGYNCDGFDLAFMEQAGLTVDAPTFDVMLEFAPIFGEYDESKGEYKRKSLRTCAGHYKYEGQNWHNSLEDTLATLHCYYGVLNDLQWTVTEEEVLEPKTMKVLLIEPQKQPRMLEIENSLESLQKAVGDHIEILYPFEQPVALVCAENGKINGMQLNRALYDEYGRLYDIITGSFLVAGIRGDNLCSLASGQANEFTARFSPPELFFRGKDGRIKVITVPNEPMLTKPVTEPTVQDGVDAVFLPGKIHGSEDQLYIIYLNANSNGGIDGSWEIEVVDYERILRLYAEVGGDADRFFGTLPDMYHGEWYYCDSQTNPDTFKEYKEMYPKADFVVGRDGNSHDEMMFLVNWAEKRAEQVRQEALPTQISTEPPKEKKGSVRL